MIKATRGTRDLLPPDTDLWNRVEAQVRDVFSRYGFQEVRTPLFEDTALFARSVGEDTDIVTKEMFTWVDGDRFNEKKIIDEWLKANLSDDPIHVAPGRIVEQGQPSFLAEIRQFGVQRQVWRGIQVGTSLTGRVELVAFGPRISAGAISALQKARSLARNEYSQEFGNLAILLRLVVPDEATKTYHSVDIDDVEVEGLAGSFFSSSQSLTLRPENTAGVVRAYIEHGLDKQGKLQKLYYIGPQFRRERPQKGRYRQFYQIGAEIVGPPSAGSELPARDAEVLEMLATLLDELGLRGWKLQLNSVGCAADRTRYNQALRDALKPVVHQMCADCQRRAETNPLRVLDCKVPEDQPIIEKLPKISEYLDDACRENFAQVRAMLDAVGIPYTINERMVRGLDYYTRTTFEFTHGDLGAQSAVLGGGRYDGLSESLDGPKAPGIGFAMGEDRLILALQAEGVTATEKLDAYIAPLGVEMNVRALKLARELRRAGVRCDLGDESFRLKKSFEAAEKSGARYIVIVGENEVKSGEFAVKDLANGKQESVSRDKLADYLRHAA
ncbi:MAG TPA: histidine--tRNA ligase [Terriglobales bacterium]|nr:histidine--tRNA ligase [Terriglobales bacterium]